MERILAILGLIIFIGGAYLCSDNKKAINWKSVGYAFIGQIIMALLLLKTPVRKCVEWAGNGVMWLLAQAVVGIDFIFGGISDNYVFFINGLLPIVFISGVMGLLYHYGIIQKFIKIIGRLMAKVLGIDVIVSVNGITNMFFGQSESLFLTKSYLPHAHDNVIFATLVSGMASISMGVISLYLAYGANVNFLLISLPLSVFGSFTILQILMPTTYVPVDELVLDDGDKGTNVIETVLNYGMSGFKAVVGVSVALMVFLSLIAMINGLLGMIHTSLSLETILGYIFYPFAVLMGVPQEEVVQVAQLLATKLVTNEAVAYGMPQFSQLSTKTHAMVTVALAGFAGIGSIPIMLGAYSSIAGNKVKTVAKTGVKALLAATIVNMMSATIIGLFI